MEENTAQEGGNMPNVEQKTSPVTPQEGISPPAPKRPSPETHRPVTEILFRIGGGLLAVTGAISEARNAQAAPVDIPFPKPLVEPTKAKTAGEALSEMGAQIPLRQDFDGELSRTAQGKQNPEVQSYFEQSESQGSARSAGSYSTPGVEKLKPLGTNRNFFMSISW